MSRSHIKVSRLPLIEIKLHPFVEGYQDLLAVTRYTLSNIHELSAEAVTTLLRIHPVCVVKGRAGSYHCIAGFRQLAIANEIVRGEIEVNDMSGIPPREQRQLALADLFLTPLVLSVNDPSLFLAFLSSPSTELLSSWVPNLVASKKHLSRALEIKRQKLYRLERKCKRNE